VITLKTSAQSAKMREAGLVVAEMLEACRAATHPGVTTAELDRIAADVLRRHGAKSSFLGYHGYPATICTSVNDEIVHGIPSPKRKLREGDIVGIDAGAIVDGWHADAAITVPVGRVSGAVADLMRVTEEALRAGIAKAVIGNRIGDIGSATTSDTGSAGRCTRTRRSPTTGQSAGNRTRRSVRACASRSSRW